MSRSKSKVHPKYKTKPRVGNWAAYDRSLVDRGSITLWLSAAAIAVWTPAPTGRRGGPRKFCGDRDGPDPSARLSPSSCQAEGFLQSLFGLMQLDLDAPDHTTLFIGAGDGVSPRARTWVTAAGRK